MDIEAVKARCAAASGSRITDSHILLRVTVATCAFDNTGLPADQSDLDKTIRTLVHDVKLFAVVILEERKSRTDLPDAIELIEEAEELLLDARPSNVEHDRQMEWCRRQAAFFAKVGSPEKSP